MLIQRNVTIWNPSSWRSGIAATAASMAVAAVLGASAGSESEPRIQSARPPRMVDLRPPRPVQLATMSDREISEIASHLAGLVPDAGDRSRVMALRVRDSALSSRDLNSEQIAQIADALSERRDVEVSAADAAAAFDRQMASLLSEVIELSRRRGRLGVYGLPLEGRDAELSNRRFGDLIAAQNVITTSRKVVALDSGTTEWQMISRALPHSIAARGDRPMFFQSNGEWRVIGGTDDDASLSQSERRARSLSGGDGGDSKARSRFSSDGAQSGGESNQEGNGGQGGEQGSAYAVHWGIKGDAGDRVDLSNVSVEQDVTLFYGYELGKHPMIREGQLLNGGIPQAMDMNLHLEEMRDDIDRLIPDAQYSGYAVIDYEEFPFYWNLLDEQYKELSRRLVRDANPGLPSNEVEQEAQSQFQAASRTFYLATLRRAKELRPHAKWGYFLNVQVFAPGEEIDDVGWLWREVDAMYPSVYAGKYSVPREESLENEWQAYANATKQRLVDRINRCRELVGPTKAVLPFVTWRYHKSNDEYGDQPLNDIDMTMQLTVGREAGADGVIMWIDLDDEQELQQFQSELDSRLGDRIRALMAGEI